MEQDVEAAEEAVVFAVVATTVSVLENAIVIAATILGSLF
jgi:hypothetical protein